MLHVSANRMLTNSSGHLKAVIMDLLRLQPMSLAELESRVDASLPTIRRAVRDLSDSKWIRPVGTDASTGGRPARLFGLDGSVQMILGVHIEIPTVNMVLMALDGTILDEYFYEPEGELLPEDATRVILRYAREMGEAYPQRVLLGIGMAVPGYIDAESGEILVVGRAQGWENYPVRTRLQASLGGLPIIMENDFDSLIRAETAYLPNHSAGNLVYLGILEGVKVSMLLNGQIYSGPFGNAGLIGRTKIGACGDGRASERYHDLEETTSVSGLCRTFASRVHHWPQVDAALAHIDSLSDRNAKVQAILEAASDGHPLCAEIVDQMFRDLSLAVVNLIFILQPTTLVIGGALSDLPVGLQIELEKAIRSQLPPLLSNHLVLKYAHTTGRYAAARGAATLFLQHYISMDTAFESQA